jgi:hypothetical protein
MALATKVRARKGQQLVALPATVARHLVIAPGAMVYWGMPRAHQALLSVKPTATRGPERRDAECPSCAAYRKEIESLRARLQQQPAKMVASALHQVRAQWFSQHDLGPTWASRIEAKLAELQRAVGELPGGRARSARRAARHRSRGVEALTLPEPDTELGGQGAGSESSEAPGATAPA